MKIMAPLWKGLSALLGASVSLLPMAPLVSYADDPMCVFVSQKGSAWVVRKDMSVKVSLKVGDLLYPGDQVLVLHGQTVHLAFDKDLQNLIQIEGESLIQLESSNPLNVKLFKGKVFAVINKKTPSSQFRITTPAAIASVRGTQYQVTHDDQAGSKVLTYEGKVAVAGYVDGKETKEVVIVSAGEKTSVKAPGKAPEPVQPMTVSEKNQLTGILSDVNTAKQNYSPDPQGKPAPPLATDKAFEKQKTETQEVKPAKDSKGLISSKPKQASGSSSQTKGDKIIF